MPEESVQEEDCASMVRELSSEHDERISFRDFAQFLLHNPDDDGGASSGPDVDEETGGEESDAN